MAGRGESGEQPKLTRHIRPIISDDKPEGGSHENFGQETLERRKGSRSNRDDRDLYDKKDVNAPQDETIDTVSKQFLNFTSEATQQSTCSFESLARNMECLTNDGGVKKKLLLEGIATPEAPAFWEDGQRLWFHYEMYGENCEPYCLDSTNTKKCASTLTLGEASLLGVYVGLRTMKKKEIADFIFEASYAYGKMGVPEFIRPNTRVRMIIQLEEVVENSTLAVEFMTDLERRTASLQEILAGVERLIIKGNAKFEKKHFRAASDRYTWALSLFDDYEPISVEQNEVVREKRYLLFANLALSYIRDEEYQNAVDICKDALKLEGQDKSLKCKVLHRYALACFHLGDFETTRTLCEQGLSCALAKEKFRNLKINAEYEIALQEDMGHEDKPKTT